MQRRPVRRRRRHSHKVYVRRQILALIVSIGLVFVVLLGIDHVARSAFGGHHNAVSTSKTKTTKVKTKTKIKPKPITPKPTLVNAPPGKNSITMSAVGDIELGNTPTLPPNPDSYLDNVKPTLAAPIVFGNLEGTLTDATDSKCAAKSTGCFAFRNPPAYATVFRNDGFTVLNSANNHFHDYGAQGVTDTTAALKSAGIVQAGLPGQIGLTKDRKTKVAFVAFAPYTDTNNLLDATAAKALITKAKSMAPVVIVYMHAGAEGANADHVTGKDETYLGENRGNPEAFAHAAIDDGASAVIASGPHVLRGLEFYKGHLIDYSLGDFASYNNFATTGNLDLSGILRLTLSSSGAFQSAAWVSLLLDKQGQPSVDTTGEAAVFVNNLSTQDFGSAAAKVEPNGSIVPVSGG